MEKEFFQHLKNIISNPLDHKYLLTVSGGVDSSVMVYLFHLCGLSFDMAHCNFHLRGEASNQDMELVKSMAQLLNKQLYIKEFDTFQMQKDSGKSIEMMARELRYGWFSDLADNYDYIVTAHHANDNAETILLNLTRGTGLKGMTGIPVFNGKIIRPLLPFTSAQIHTFANRHNITYHDDQTNFSEDYQRNKIRLSVIPKLEEINQDVINTFTRDISLLKKQYQFYSSHIEKIKNQIVTFKNHQYFISIDQLLLLNGNDLEIVLYELIKDFGFNYSTMVNMIQAMQAQSGKRFFSPTHLIIKDRQQFIISELTEDKDNRITIHSIEELKEYGFEVQLFENETDYLFESNPNNLYICVDRLSFPLTLRHWEKGDYFYPFGMKGKKKLSDYFTDQKIDLLTKQQINLLCCRNEIIWVVGYRTDNRYKIAKGNKLPLYKIRYHGSI